MSIRHTILPALLGLLAPGVALAEVPRVAADIAPVHALAARVMEGLGEPALIVPPGTSPHGHSMRPSEARSVQEADAVFWIGPALEPWMAGAIATLAPDAVSVALLDAPGTQVLDFREGATFAGRDQASDAVHGHPHDSGEVHAGEHDQNEAGEGDFHEHGDDHGVKDAAAADAGHVNAEAAHLESHEGVDPHAWLDPDNAKTWLDTIAAALSELDPSNAETYAANAEAGKREIDAAAAQATITLEPARDLQFVVFHDAYQYYEVHFGLSTVGAIELADASDPSPARIEEVRDAVRQRDVACIFSEPQFNQRLVQIVAEGTEARTGIVDPLGSGIAPGPDFYPHLLTTIADEIAACAG